MEGNAGDIWNSVTDKTTSILERVIVALPEATNKFPQRPFWGGERCQRLVDAPRRARGVTYK
ncbi:hypothetical protein [Allorhodopirellula heiligendammensis]|uniref:hypothetical protein n=1 Tax=Allorhodopirellula heiligendammensis TaxID=2714739 RepID=UPI0011B468C4|nr:hypothetical protein [Allorhodopirellula heiligendammensis]